MKKTVANENSGPSPSLGDNHIRVSGGSQSKDIPQKHSPIFWVSPEENQKYFIF